MLYYIFLAVLLVQLQCPDGHVITVGNEVVHDKELQMAFLINRHGERTPDEDELSLSKSPEKIKNLTKLLGYEALTNAGKRRGYQLGKFIRQRYGARGLALISNVYDFSEILVRSTDKDRTKMMAQVAMAAVYPPEEVQQWDEAVGKVWQPVPYTAYPLKEDYLRFYSNCKRYETLMDKAKLASIHEEFAPYKDLFAKMEKETGANFTENPTRFQTLHDLFDSQTSLGIDLPQWAVPLKQILKEAAMLSYKLYFRNDEMKRIGGGVLLSQFTEMASEIAAGRPVAQRLRMFSAHDFNIGSLMEVCNVDKDDSIPKYGSAFMLELYKDRRTGQFSVLPVYLRQAGEVPETLSISQCGPEHCELSKFQELTKKYLLPKDEYYQLCDISTEL